MWQAEHIAASLSARFPEADVSFVGRMTKGDKILDQALSKVGGKDLFVKEIEAAILEGDAELAVHSLKDMPTELPKELVIAAFPPREDPRDALILADGLPPADDPVDRLPKGARVGTSSLRRAAQLLHRRPDLEIVSVRGNVQTRISKVQELGLAGVVLAYAGLLRLGLADRVSGVLDPATCLPAIGQGILAVETRAADPELLRVVGALDDRDARDAATAERAFLAKLRGGCQVPIAGHATFEGPTVHLVGLVASLDGKTVIRRERSGPRELGAELGRALAEEVLGAGADRILDELLGKS